MLYYSNFKSVNRLNVSSNIPPTFLLKNSL